MATTGLGRARTPGIGAVLLSLILLAVAALVFAGIYLAVPDHYGALLWIGSVSLVLAVLCYVLQSMSRDPLIQRALGWGFLGMGFTLLFLTVGVSPSITTSGRIVGLIVLLLLLAVAIAGVLWRMRAVASDAGREAKRTEWASQPAPNAFDYTAARSAAPSEPSGYVPPPPPPGGG